MWKFPIFVALSLDALELTLPWHSAIDCKIQRKGNTSEDINDKCNIFGDIIVNLDETETDIYDQVEVSAKVDNLT